ncbi:hypothetical protein BG842_03125 [Haladaptatus sp. W1]|nr:hypothetical protein BG842_03125 [Haladaptatus sp. W1]
MKSAGKASKTRRDQSWKIIRDRSGTDKIKLQYCYQGFSNAKFERIECHEAINAYVWEILLETKAVLKEHGWRIIHGIVDSMLVTPIEGEESTSLSDVTCPL